MFIDKSLKDYISLAASGDSTPGGGSVSALVASLGGALTSMVMNLSLGKKSYEELPEEVKDKMLENFEEIKELIEALNGIVDEDTKAFDGVMQAFKLPKESDKEKEARSKAIQEGYKVALEVPLRCARKCLRLLELEQIFAVYGNAGAITDVGAGTLFAYAGLEASLFNVKINLASIKDEEYNKEVGREMNQILKEGKELRDKSLEKVYSRI